MHALKTTSALILAGVVSVPEKHVRSMNGWHEHRPSRVHRNAAEWGEVWLEMATAKKDESTHPLLDELDGIEEGAVLVSTRLGDGGV